MKKTSLIKSLLDSFSRVIQNGFELTSLKRSVWCETKQGTVITDDVLFSDGSTQRLSRSMYFEFPQQSAKTPVFLTGLSTCIGHLCSGKESACNAGDLGSIPGSGRSSGKGNGNPLQYSCLESSMDRGAWWATVHGVTESQTGLSD